MDWMNLIDAGATLAGAGFVAYQIRQLKRQESREFVASYNARYERIVAGIPLGVMLGDDMGDLDLEGEIARAFFDYFQLCEEQMSIAVDDWRWVEGQLSDPSDPVSPPPSSFLDRVLGRHPLRLTIVEWHNGMALNLSRPGFSQHLDGIVSASRAPIFEGFCRHFNRTESRSG